MHWHGLRLDNRSDGTHETQAPIPIGGRFSCSRHVPGSRRLLVPPAHPRGLRPGDGPLRQRDRRAGGPRLLGAGAPGAVHHARRRPARRRPDRAVQPPETNYSAMGRFGDTLLIAGEPELGLTAKQGEVVRVYLTNTANTRVFKVALPGARMKLVGGDSGRVEHEQFVEDVVLAPSERAVVDVLFEQPGELVLEHRTPEKTYRLGTIAVADERAEPPLAEPFGTCAATPSSPPSASGSPPWLDAPSRTRRWPSWPRWTSTPSRDRPSTSARCTPRSSPRSRATARVRHEAAAAGDDLHVPDAPGRRLRGAGPLPELRHEAAAGAAGRAGRRPRAPRPRRMARRARPSDTAHHGHDHAATGGIEWEDDMVDVNRITTPANTRWKLIDRSTDAANHAIQWQFTRRRPGEDPPGQRDGLRPPDAPPVPHPRRRPLPGHRPRRGARAQPGLERHGAGAHRGGRRHPARRDQPRALDGALPHRRAPRERHDVQLRRAPAGRSPA